MIEPLRLDRELDPHVDGFSQTETCFVLSAVNGERSQSAQRSRSPSPGQPRHQVELGRGDGAERASRSAATGRRRARSGGRRAAACRSRTRRRRRACRSGRRPRAAAGLDADLDDEAAARLEVRRRVREHVDLPVLGRDVVDRVEDDVDERERARRPSSSPCRRSRPGSRPSSSAARRPCPARGRCPRRERRGRRAAPRSCRCRSRARAPRRSPSGSRKSTTGSTGMPAVDVS